MASSIGAYQFISLKGAVVAPNEQIQPIVRAGVDGTALKKTGRRGVPFTLRSMVDAPSLAVAHAMVVDYRGLVGMDPVNLVQGGYSYVADGFRVAVLDVRAVEPQQISTAVGGLNSPSLAKLVCEWSLLAIEIV